MTCLQEPAKRLAGGAFALERGVFVLDKDDPLQRQAIRQCVFQFGNSGAGGDQQLDPAILDQMRDLGRTQGGVDGHENRIGRRGAHDRDRGFGPLFQKYSHPLAGADPGFAQGMGKAARVGGQRGIKNDVFLKNQRGLAGILRRRAKEQIVECHSQVIPDIWLQLALMNPAGSHSR